MQSVLSFPLGGGEWAVDLVPIIFPPRCSVLLQQMALGLRAVEITAGALTRLELNEWGAAEMGLQKALEPDGWMDG